MCQVYKPYQYQFYFYKSNNGNKQIINTYNIMDNDPKWLHWYLTIHCGFQSNNGQIGGGTKIIKYETISFFKNVLVKI